MLVENFGDRLASRLPLKRLGEPADIANLATFLASDAASWITGETFVIDGGCRRDGRHLTRPEPALRVDEPCGTPFVPSAA